jgi:hypothetical protein
LEVHRDGRRFAWGRADGNGAFRFTLPAGGYTVRVEREGYLAAEVQLVLPAKGLTREIYVRRMESLTPVKPAPQPEATHGVVRLRIVERSKSGALVPVSLANVVVQRDGKPVAEGRADREGRYQVRVPRGTYTFEVKRLPYFHPGRIRVEVNAAERSRDVILQRIEIN